MSSAYRDFLASAFMLATVVILVLVVWLQRPYRGSRKLDNTF